MSNLKTLTIISVTAFVAIPALAQDPEMKKPTETLSSNFASADLDQDGQLNADEYVTFAVMRADAGDEAFKDVVLGGEYKSSFMAYDADGSGGIQESELIQNEASPEWIVPEEDETNPVSVPEL